ncbi:MAG: hypothetical protein ABIK27_01220 [Bacteroidota bacterium]
MKNIKKDLNAVNEELMALTKKIEELIVAAGKVEKPKLAKKPKAKVVKAKSVKKTVAKKAPVKKPAAKKPGKLSAIDTVLAVINKSEMGINTAELMKKTGFNAKKVHNNVFKLKKQGKIKAGKKGVYVKA